MCHDFAFWQSETGRCIAKEYLESKQYTFPPICNRTEFNCMDGDFWNYCPNKDKSCEGYKVYGWEDPFFCNNSKTCIPKGKPI